MFYCFSFYSNSSFLNSDKFYFICREDYKIIFSDTFLNLLTGINSFDWILYPEFGWIRITLSLDWKTCCLIKDLLTAVLGLIFFGLLKTALMLLSSTCLNWFCWKLWEGLNGLLIVWENGLNGWHMFWGFFKLKKLRSALDTDLCLFIVNFYSKSLNSLKWLLYIMKM